MSYRITVLGCGNSSGVPAAGNYWGKCDPREPKNRRSRSSIVVQDGRTAILIDTGPDLRYQLNREDVHLIDGVFYTHAHSDHCHGIDDIRAIVRVNNMDTMPMFANQECMDDLQKRFAYIFQGDDKGLYPPLLSPNTLTKDDFGTEKRFKTIKYTCFEQDHGNCTTVGYRFGEFAYSVDILTLDNAAINALRGVKIWMVDSAGYNMENNPVHVNLETIYRLNEQIGAETVYLTSLTLGMDYQTLLNELPDGYLPAYDGLVINAQPA